MAIKTARVTIAGRGPDFMHILLATLMTLIMLLTTALARAEEYQLGSMDKLRIRVVEWQTAEGSVRDWSTLSGDYIVGPSGNVSLPFIGELVATGKTTAQIAETIGEELQQKFGLSDRPDASVELAEFRPVFVSGDVRTPGRYPYDPGLTVLKALSLAGGLRRAADDGMRVERDFINARGNYEVYVTERDSLLAKLARLTAEAAGKQQIEFPDELKQSANGQKLIADETAFMVARDKRLRIQLGEIEDLKKLLQGEIVSLEKKIVTQNRQMELAREELKGVDKLADRGLVANTRVLTTERLIAELEGKVLDFETAALRAKQDISKATQDATTLQNDREAEIGQERQEAEAEIAKLNFKISMYKDLMGEALAIAPEAATVGNDAAAISFSIVRTIDGKATETAADESTPVLPGDVVKVGVAAGILAN